MDQAQTTRFVSRFEHPALQPRLHPEGFRIHQLVHTGLPHREPPLRIWDKYNREYTTSLSTEYNLSLEARHNPQQTPLHLEGQALRQYKPITSHLRDSNTNSTSHQRELTTISTSHQRELTTTSKSTSTQERYHKSRRITTWLSISTTNNFPTNKDPIDRIE